MPGGRTVWHQGARRGVEADLHAVCLEFGPLRLHRFCESRPPCGTDGSVGQKLLKNDPLLLRGDGDRKLSQAGVGDDAFSIVHIAHSTL